MISMSLTCARTFSASTLTMINPGVFWRELVAVLAMCLCSHLSGPGLSACHGATDCQSTSPQVLPMGHRLDVMRIAATPHAAEMIQLKSFRDWTYENLVANDVSLALSLVVVSDSSVPVAVQLAHEYPAARLGDDLDVSKQSLLRVGGPSKLVFRHCDSSKVSVFRAARCATIVAARPFYCSAEASA